MIKWFHNETNYKFLSAPVHLNHFQLAIVSISSMDHTKAITVLHETYRLHMNKTDNIEENLLLFCLHLFTNSSRIAFNINNPISRHTEITSIHNYSGESKRPQKALASLRPETTSTSHRLE